jgi:hypothetical protein
MQVYNTIEDLPIYNYWKCINKKDLNFLIKEDSKMLKSLKEKKIYNSWLIIDEEMTELNLQDASFISDLIESRDFEILKLDQLLNPTALNNILIQSKKADIIALQGNDKIFDLYGSISSMSRFLGFRIDPKKVTVSEYFANIRLMKEGANKKITNNGN